MSKKNDKAVNKVWPLNKLAKASPQVSWYMRLAPGSVEGAPLDRIVVGLEGPWRAVLLMFIHMYYGHRVFGAKAFSREEMLALAEEIVRELEAERPDVKLEGCPHAIAHCPGMEIEVEVGAEQDDKE